MSENEPREEYSNRWFCRNIFTPIENWKVEPDFTATHLSAGKWPQGIMVHVKPLNGKLNIMIVWVSGPEFHLLCADLGSGRGGSGPLLDLNPGLGVQVGEAGGEALGHRLEVGDVWLSLVLVLHGCGSPGRPCSRHFIRLLLLQIREIANCQLKWHLII